jgi:hypothetical protein
MTPECSLELLPSHFIFSR